MRKLLRVLSLVVVGTTSLASFASAAHSEEYPCPTLSIHLLDGWHLGCMRSCHIFDGRPDKVDKREACLDRCNKDFDKCNARRREVMKHENEIMKQQKK
jgi:hypothetical protein